MVRGAPVRGAAFLSESLANYSAMLVTEKTYGPEAGHRVYGFQMERYLRGRATQSPDRARRWPGPHRLPVDPEP